MFTASTGRRPQGRPPHTVASCICKLFFIPLCGPNRSCKKLQQTIRVTLHYRDLLFIMWSESKPRSRGGLQQSYVDLCVSSFDASGVVQGSGPQSCFRYIRVVKQFRRLVLIHHTDILSFTYHSLQQVIMSINTENAPSRSIFCGKLGEKIHFRRSRNSSSMSELATPSVTQNPRSTNTTGAESRRTDATHGGPQKRDGSNGGDTTIVPQSANSGSRVADEEKATAETLYKELGILYQKSYDNGILHPHCTPEDSYRARVASEQSRQQSIQELQSEYRSLFVQ